MTVQTTLSHPDLETVPAGQRAVRPLHVAIVDEELPYPLTSGKRIRTYNLLRRVERLRFHGHNFFLRGADLYRIWPIAGHADERSPRMPRRMDSAEKPQLELPPKVKKSADTVLALTRQGYTWGWSEREALLTKVRELTGDKSLHISTLKRALRHLRDQGLITKSGIATLVPTGSEPT